MSTWMETFKGAVLVSEYDAQAHMNSEIYVRRFDQATWFLLSAIGLTPQSIAKQGRRIGIVREAFQFLRELRGGELIVIQSGFVAVGRKYVRFVHQMYDIERGRLVATSDQTAVEVSLKTDRSATLPDKRRKAAEGLLVTPNADEAAGPDGAAKPAKAAAKGKKKNGSKKIGRAKAAAPAPG